MRIFNTVVTTAIDNMIKLIPRDFVLKWIKFLLALVHIEMINGWLFHCIFKAFWLIFDMKSLCIIKDFVNSFWEKKKTNYKTLKHADTIFCRQFSSRLRGIKLEDGWGLKLIWTALFVENWTLLRDKKKDCPSKMLNLFYQIFLVEHLLWRRGDK